MIVVELIKRLEASVPLFHSSIHGLHHWQTVARNGLYLAQYSGADQDVVKHFAYFHDSRRENEGHDPEHGPRAATFLKAIRAEVALDDNQFQLLIRACSGHTHATRNECPTLGTCWDADRLDLGRVGIRPCSRYLFTDRAKGIADTGNFNPLVEFAC